LVTTAQEVENRTQKVISALRKPNVFIVNDNFIHDSVQQGHKADERPYVLAESDSSRMHRTVALVCVTRLSLALPQLCAFVMCVIAAFSAHVGWRRRERCFASQGMVEAQVYASLLLPCMA
jgi:hypothetical protein